MQDHGGTGMAEQGAVQHHLRPDRRSHPPEEVGAASLHRRRHDASLIDGVLEIQKRERRPSATACRCFHPRPREAIMTVRRGREHRVIAGRNGPCALLISPTCMRQ